MHKLDALTAKSIGILPWLWCAWHIAEEKCSNCIVSFHYLSIDWMNIPINSVNVIHIAIVFLRISIQSNIFWENRWTTTIWNVFWNVKYLRNVKFRRKFNFTLKIHSHTDSQSFEINIIKCSVHIYKAERQAHRWSFDLHFCIWMFQKLSMLSDICNGKQASAR